MYLVGVFLAVVAFQSHLGAVHHGVIFGRGTEWCSVDGADRQQSDEANYYRKGFHLDARLKTGEGKTWGVYRYLVRMIINSSYDLLIRVKKLI